MIDTHSHWLTPAYMRLLEEEGRVDPGVEATRRIVLGAKGADLLQSLDSRFREMAEAQIKLSVISIPPPGVGFSDPQGAANAAAEVNDDLVAACILKRRWPRFSVSPQVNSFAAWSFLALRVGSKPINLNTNQYYGQWLMLDLLPKCIQPSSRRRRR